MNIIHTSIEGVVIIEPKVFKDARGYFFESFAQREFEEKVRKINFVPRGFAHGFAVLTETAVFQYKCDNFYHPEADAGISIKDESLGIEWRIPTDQALLSEKDLKHPCLKDFDSPFTIDMNLYPE